MRFTIHGSIVCMGSNIWPVILLFDLLINNVKRKNNDQTKGGKHRSTADVTAERRKRSSSTVEYQ